MCVVVKGVWQCDRAGWRSAVMQEQDRCYITVQYSAAGVGCTARCTLYTVQLYSRSTAWPGCCWCGAGAWSQYSTSYTRDHCHPTHQHSDQRRRSCYWYTQWKREGEDRAALKHICYWVIQNIQSYQQVTAEWGVSAGRCVAMLAWAGTRSPHSTAPQLHRPPHNCTVSCLSLDRFAHCTSFAVHSDR